MKITLFGRDYNIKKTYLVSALIMIIVILGFLGYFMRNKEDSIIINANVKETNLPLNTHLRTSEASLPLNATSPEKIKIYVTGCVKKPGIVELCKGQIIDDAIKAAGGPTKDADLDNINLVYQLKENVTLKIKSIKSPGIARSIADESQKSAGIGVEMVNNSGGALLMGEEETKSGRKVNINTASKEQLDGLPGVGPSTADKIISFRKENGSFKSVEDIKKVPGIGESKFKQLKDLISAE